MKSLNKLAIIIPFIVFAFVIYGVQQEPGAIQSISYKLFMGMAACVCVWSVTRLFDLVSGISFKELLERATSENQINYVRTRYISLSALFGLVVAFA